MKAFITFVIVCNFIVLDASHRDTSRLVRNEINEIVYDKQNRSAYREFPYGVFFLTKEDKFIFAGNDEMFYEIDSTDERRVFIYAHPDQRIASRDITSLDDEFKEFFNDATRYKGQMLWWKRKWDEQQDKVREKNCCSVC